MASSLGYNVTMTLPATSRQTRAFDDRADALAHFFLRAGEAPRLLAYDDAVGCPLDQALAALEWTAAVGILAEDDLLHAGRLAADAAAAVVERRDGDQHVFIYFGPRVARSRHRAISDSKTLFCRCGEVEQCGFTTPHRVDGRGKDRHGLGLASTTDAHAHELTRRNIGTCAVLRYPYIVATRLGGKGRDLVSQLRLQDGSERKFRGGRRCKQGLRRPAIREEPLRLG